jgi:hypothetical protein
VKAGGIDVQHNRRLLAAADVRIGRRARLIARLLRELAA